MKKDKVKISDQVLSKIKKEKVKPIPKWNFVLKHGFLWVLLVITLLIGAVFLGISIFELTDVEWNLRPLLGMNIFGLLFRVFPYFWAVLLVLISVLAYYNFVNTPKGYRYPKYQIILFGILLMILTATAFHYAGFAKNARNFLHENAPPPLHQFMPDKAALYNMPDKGILAGEIVEVNEKYIVVMGMNKEEWKVDVIDLDLPEGKSLEEGQKVKVLGEKIGDSEFKAREIRPWQMGDPLRLKNKLNGEKKGPKNNGGKKDLTY